MQQYPVLINNTWFETGEKKPVINPYTGASIAEVFRATAAEAKKAVDTAVQAFSVTRNLASYKKADFLRKTSELIKSNGETLARTISMESGKPLKAAHAEVSRAATTFQLAAEEASRIPGDVIPLDISSDAGSRIGITRRFPVGPILAITPFNFPLNLVAHKIAPALAAGNTVIHKPASTTPLTALQLGKLLLEAGMPAGAVNIIPCAPAVAETIIADPRITMISFTGSAAVGWQLKTRAGKKKVALELGGNAGVIVEPDADLGLAVDRCVMGGYSYAGQVCISVQRIYIHERVYDEFKKRFVSQVKALKVGDPLLPETDIGPLIEEHEVHRVHAWVEEAKARGGKILTGGHFEGAVYEPTVLQQVPKDTRCVSQELFAPVTVLFPYREFDEALQEVNDSRYGLQAGVFTQDINTILKAFNRLEVGGVIINDVPTYRVDNFPYGGVKDSGAGREGVKYALEEMTEIKVLVLRNVQ
jgi:glyceraldehyde-3-phosphate dehydrogenase (NADP+)